MWGGGTHLQRIIIIRMFVTMGEVAILSRKFIVIIMLGYAHQILNGGRVTECVPSTVYYFIFVTNRVRDNVIWFTDIIGTPCRR